MSQNDFTIANQGFPAFRADLNSALQALATNNSGTSAPSTTFANMWWYDSTNNIMYIRNEDNDAWIKFAELDQTNDKFVLSGTLQLDDGSASAPALTFNSDTNMGIYRGGTDILRFVTAGADRLQIAADGSISTPTSGASNVRIGVNAGNSITSGGNYNVVVGDEAGTALTTGDKNTFLGSLAGDALNTASDNLAIGYASLTTDTKGNKSTAIGRSALGSQNFTSSTDTYNVAVGYDAGGAVTTGTVNTLIGGLAGDALTTGGSNVAVGKDSLSSETGGAANVAVGKGTLGTQNANTVAYNTAVGHETGGAITSGIQNTLIGALAGDALTDADYNIAIGVGALGSDTQGSRSVAIGYNALRLQNFSSATESRNTAIGMFSGNDVTTGTFNTFLGYDSGGDVTTGTKNTVIGSYNGNQGGLDIRTSSNNIVLSDGDGVPRLHINSDGRHLIGGTSNSPATTNTAGISFDGGNHVVQISRNQSTALELNRKGNDGNVCSIRQDGTIEGNISVSGTTVTYGGGHLGRWSRLLDNSKDATILKGTVMTNLDEMVEWGDEDNEQLNRMAVSSVESDANVSGVFVSWDNDDDYNDMMVAMTGDMVIRIAKDTTVSRGDLLMSAGDGTAKPQGDDIVRSKTIAKVTSTNKSHTYDDGTYLVPCVLMAC